MYFFYNPVLSTGACEVRTRAFGDARVATNLQEAQKYFANSYLLGISPLPPSLSAPLPCRKASLALSLLKANTDSASYPTFARDKATSRASLSRPQLHAPFFLRRRGEAGNIPTKTVQITTGLRRAGGLSCRGCANDLFCDRDKDQKSSPHPRVPLPFKINKSGPRNYW